MILWFFSFPIYISLIYFSFLTALAKTSCTILNRNRESVQPCLVPDFSEIALTLHLISCCLSACWILPLLCFYVEERSMFITLHKDQVQVDQTLQQQQQKISRYMDSNRRKSGKESQMHRLRGNFSEQNANGPSSKINNCDITKLKVKRHC